MSPNVLSAISSTVAGCQISGRSVFMHPIRVGVNSIFSIQFQFRYFQFQFHHSQKVSIPIPIEEISIQIQIPPAEI